MFVEQNVLTISKLRDIYYKPEHMWRGKVAVEKLPEASRVPKKVCLKF